MGISESRLNSKSQEGDSELIINEPQTPLEKKNEDSESKGGLDHKSGSKDALDAKSEKESNIVGASFNLIKTIIGAGIISLPAATKESGLLTGIMLLGIMGVVTDYTLYILVSSGVARGKLTFQETAQEAFGRRGSIIVSVVQFLAPFSGLFVYIMISGHAVSAMMSGIFYAAGITPPDILVNEMFLKTIIILTVIIPLSLIRDIAGLDKFSGVALLFLVCLEGIVLYEMITMYCPVRCYDFTVLNSTIQPPDQPCCESSVSSWFINFELFSALGIITAAYLCHHNTFVIYNSLKKRTVKRFMVTTHISVGVAMVMFIVLGGLGYITFVQSVDGDLLNNYCHNDIAASVARVLYAINVIFTYPVQLCVCREVLEIGLQGVPRKWLKNLKDGKVKSIVESFLYSPLRGSWLRHFFLTFALVGVTAAVAIPVSDLEAFLNITSSLINIPLMFIIPSLIYLKLTSEKGRVAMVNKILNVVIIFSGIGLTLLGTGVGIYRVVTDSTGSQLNPLYCSGNQGSVDVCPIEGFRNLSSSSVAAFWGCDCNAIFEHNHPQLCQNWSTTYI